MLPYLSAMLHLVSIKAVSPLMLKSLTHQTRHQLPSRLLSTSLGVAKNGSVSDTWYVPALMDHMLYRIRECNKVPDHVQQSLIDFQVDGKILGKVRPVVQCDINVQAKQCKRAIIAYNTGDSKSSRSSLFDTFGILSINI
jgi:hypothetical protein